MVNTVRNITKTLAVMEDLAVGRGTVLQKRGNGNKIDLHIVVESIEALNDVDTNKYTRARLYTSSTSYVDYVFVENNWIDLSSEAQNVVLSVGQSVQGFVDSFTLKIFQSPSSEGLTEIQTRTVDAGEVYEVRKTSDDSLATIYSDAAGTVEIVQNGTSNVSDSTGIVEFFVADGDYYVEVGSVKSNLLVGLSDSEKSNLWQINNDIRGWDPASDGVSDDTDAMVSAGKSATVRGSHALLNYGGYRTQIDGDGVYTTTFKPVSDSSSVIKMSGNDGSLSNFYVGGTGFDDVVGVLMDDGTKFTDTRNIRVDDCSIALYLPNCTYSYFSNIMLAQNDIGIKIGETGSTAWRGDLRFNYVYIPSGRLGINIATSSSTVITFDQVTTEGMFIAYDNSASITDTNSYLDDGGRYTLQDGDIPSEGCTYVGREGSFARFVSGDSIASGYNWEKLDGAIQSQIRLEGTSEKPAVIVVENKGVKIQNQYDISAGWPAASRRMFSYQANESDIVEFNNVPCIKSTVNQNHNRAPFLLYEGYTPLRSKNPKNNYMLNGTFSSEVYNNQLVNNLTQIGATGVRTIDYSVMNQYGGGILQQRGRFGFKIRYTVPDRLIGVKMALITYVTSVQPESNAPGIRASGSDLADISGSLYFTAPKDTYRVDNRTPYWTWIEVTPTKKQGAIELFVNIKSSDVTDVGWDLSSIVLTEYENRHLLDQFVDVNEISTGSGATSERPVVSVVGERFFDTDLGKPVFWSGSGWVDAAGASS